MTNFKKGDLKLTYDWTAAVENDNAKITGVPDSTLLNRHEGYEVLPFLNRYMTAKEFTSSATFTKLEKAVRNDVPSSTRSHANIKTWLNENFKE